MAPEVYPDGVRGIYSLLVGSTILDHQISPALFLPATAFQTAADGSVLVHVERDNTNHGDYDRVEDIRITAYGPSPLVASDISEAILAMICDDAVETPSSDVSSEQFFDSIRQRTGPTLVSYPGADVFPTVCTVAVRARPIFA